MNNIYRPRNPALLVLVCAFMQACQSPPVAAPVTVQKPPAKPKEIKPVIATTPAPASLETPRAAPASNADVLALKEGIALYNNGDYNGSIKKLSSATEIWASHNKTLQISALKYMAFSYCITSRAQLCRQHFERALKIDPSFDLQASEIGHPTWGPIFLKAKKAK